MLITPHGPQPSASEQEAYLTQAIGNELRGLCFQTFQQLISIRTAKRGEYDEKPIAELARETMVDAMNASYHAAATFQSQSKKLDELAGELARAILKHAPK